MRYDALPQAPSHFGFQPGRFQRSGDMQVDTANDTYLPRGPVGEGLKLIKFLLEKIGSSFSSPGSDALIGGPAAIRTFYHGTTPMAAESIVQRGFDLSRFGTGADAGIDAAGKGFYGRGVYLTESPEQAEIYSLLASRPDISPFKAFSMLMRDENTGGATLRALVDDSRLLDATKAPLSAKDIEVARSQRQVVKSINRHAKKTGLAGVLYPDETVVFDPSAIEKVERYK